MDRIRDWLYIGGLRDVGNAEAVGAAGIGAALLLAQDVALPGVTCRYLRVEDREPLAPDLLRAGLAFVREQREQGNAVAIVCGRGVSRSATFAIAALKEAEELPLLDALRVLVAAHPPTRSHPALWQSLGDYFGEPVTLLELVRTCRTPGWT